jgi:hypothetical protein
MCWNRNGTDSWALPPAPLTDLTTDGTASATYPSSATKKSMTERTGSSDMLRLIALRRFAASEPVIVCG